MPRYFSFLQAFGEVVSLKVLKWLVVTKIIEKMNSMKNPRQVKLKQMFRQLMSDSALEKKT